MPLTAPQPCGHPGCAALVRERTYCEAHTVKQVSSSKMGYDSKWVKARRAFLQQHPLCAECLRQGRTTQALVVDHIVPHRGDRRLFWDRKNWQALCDYRSPYNCHGVKTGSGR